MEQWKTILDFPHYEISNQGRIRNINTNQILKPWADGKGRYLQISLCDHGRVKKYLMHRLVAQYFIPNPNNYPEINHIDYDIKNNRYENLEWVTRKENMYHAFQKHSPVRNYKESFLYKDCELVGEFKSVESAARYAHQEFGVSQSSICKYRKVGSLEIIAKAQTTIPEGSTPEDELLVEVPNPYNY